MLVLDHVTKAYPVGRTERVVAVDDLSLEVARGEFLVVTGRSGSGKTTLLNLAAGLADPSSGRVRLDGVDWAELPDARRSRLRREKLGFVFQFPSLMPGLTALENVLVPSVLGRSRDRQGVHRRAGELLAELGLEGKRRSYPHQLSAGEQQRVVIARALLGRPALLLADEPTSDLDEETEEEIMERFARIHAAGGLTVVLVTHASALVRFGTRSVRMSRGRLVDVGARGHLPSAGPAGARARLEP